MIFVYIEEGANLARILREVRERETYIEEQVELGIVNGIVKDLDSMY
jgi:hypothetical protein